MKKTLLSASAILLALSSPAAIAAESGFYAGVTAGYSNSQDDYTETTGGVVTDSGNADIKGADLGVLGGYRHYFPGGFFVGGEGETTFSTADDTIVIGGVPIEAEKKHAFGLYLKPGYQFTDKFAAFGTLGWKWTKYELSALGASAEDTIDGLALGGGVEYTFSPKISLAAEYLRVNPSDETEIAGGVVTEDEYKEDIVKVALKYHF